MTNLMPPPEVKNRVQGLIHIAKKDLKLDDDAYRTALYSITGKSSTKEMDLSEMNKVLEAFIVKGFKVTVKAKPNPKVAPINKSIKLPTTKPRDNDPRLGKIWRLWYVLREHGKTAGTAKALNAFIKRQTGLDNMNFLKTPEQYESVIEGLKAWCKREGIRLEK